MNEKNTAFFLRIVWYENRRFKHIAILTGFGTCAVLYNPFCQHMGVLFKQTFVNTLRLISPFCPYAGIVQIDTLVLTKSMNTYLWFSKTDVCYQNCILFNRLDYDTGVWYRRTVVFIEGAVIRARYSFYHYPWNRCIRSILHFCPYQANLNSFFARSLTYSCTFCFLTMSRVLISAVPEPYRRYRKTLRRFAIAR